MILAANKSVSSTQPSRAFWSNPQTQRALHWIKNNPEAWYYMVKLAKQQASLQRKISIRWIMEEARRKHYETKGGQPLSINNSLSPALARLLIIEIPEIRPYIVTRHSVADNLHNQYQ